MKQTIKELLNKDLEWHENNQNKDKSDEFQNGFIKGLQQAINLIDKLEE